MTGRERFNRQMYYQGVDRSFNMESGCRDNNFTTPEDWKKVKEEHFDLKNPARILDIAALKERVGDDGKQDYPLGVWYGFMIGKIRDMLTFEGLAYATFDYPDMVDGKMFGMG